MSSILLRFEAFESRIISYSCPRGSPARVHSLRLCRSFRSTPRAVLPFDQIPLHHHEGYDPSTIGLLTFQSQPPRIVEESVRDEVEAMSTPTTRELLRKTVPRSKLPRYLRIQEAIVPTTDFIPINSSLSAEDTLKTEEANIYSALRNKDHHSVMRSLMNIVQLESQGYPSATLVSAPPSTFSEIIRCIDPKYFLDPYRQIFQEISPTSTHLLGVRNVIGADNYYEFCSVFLEQASRIMNARRRHWPLTVSDYKYLLKCAKAVGNARAAEIIWKTMTATPPKVGGGKPVVPDAEAFNHFLAVKCWQDKMIPTQRYRLRVIEANFAPRSWLIPPHSLRAHRVGRQGIKDHASRLFKQMVDVGVTGNEETFCLMIIALGREADMAGIASILARVWNINVEAIMTQDDSEIPPPTRYGSHSPFFPSNHLLYSIAHAYGINNDISTALRLIDYVSRQYSVPIPLNVWNELLQWTSVLSHGRLLHRKKHGIEQPTGRNVGELPVEAVTNLWNTMTSSPYNVIPTIQMYNRLMTNLLARKRFGEMQLRMEEARKVLKNEISILSKKEAAYISVMRRNNKSVVEARARDLIYARFRVWRNRQYVKRWVRILLRRASNNLRYNETWSSQNVPNIVRDWILFLPNPVKYRISSGHVSFWSGTHVVKKCRAGMLQRRARREAKTLALWAETGDFSDELSK